MNTHVHIPVLQNQVIHYLNPRPGDCIVDATVGLGGHAELILKHIGSTGTLIAIDQDAANLARAKEHLKLFKNIVYIHANFESLAAITKEFPRIQGVLFDLGLSSPHVDDPTRGFSFQKEGPLDMRFDISQKLTAYEIVNKWPLKDLISLFFLYGEERNSKSIAAAICRERDKKPIRTTVELAAIITSVSRSQPRHPATRVFQALRIAVNREIEVLGHALPQAVALLARCGRLVTISYHSLEDRIVKNFFRNEASDCICDKKLHPVCICHKIPTLKILTKKPILPTEEEIAANPRARSAKLRAAERL